MTDTAASAITEQTRETCRGWIGRRREIADSMAPEPARKLAVLLDRDLPDDGLPPTWHWAYFNRGIPLADQGDDLHERLGLSLPPVPLARRMWAAGEVRVLRPLRLGMPATRTTTVANVAFKEGRSGTLCFVDLRHEIAQADDTCIDEIQTVVYRDRGTPEAALRAPEDPVPEGYFVHPESQLFFYSCVTHNGHRIHWDRSFCREVEGYPDLVVHGPLMATKLCDAMRDGIGPLTYRYRAQAPVFSTTPVRLLPGAPGPERRGQIERSDGVVSMVATLTAG